MSVGPSDPAMGVCGLDGGKLGVLGVAMPEGSSGMNRTLCRCS
jgi:hypothetical protein